MDGAFGWIGGIVEWFGKWFPRFQIVDTTHGAVKFVWGKNVVPLGPGWHWWWPISTQLTVYPTARQAVNLQAQTMTTQDGKTILIGGVLVYEITDIEAAVAYTYEPEETAKTIVLAAIHDCVTQYTWDELLSEHRSGKLGREMRAEAKKTLDKYGFKVLTLTLTDLAPVKIYKLVQASGSDKF